MRTKDIHKMLGGQGGFHLISEAKQRELLADTQAARAAIEQRQGEVQLNMPVFEALQREIDRARFADVIHDESPAITKFDAYQAAKASRDSQRRDPELSGFVSTMEQAWRRDPDGIFTVGQLGEYRETYRKLRANSTVVETIDRVFPKYGFNTLNTRKLSQIAAEIETQHDFDILMHRAGLKGNRPDQIRARTFVLEQVQRRMAQNENDIATQVIELYTSGGAGMPGTPTPFAQIAQQLGISEEDVGRIVEDYLEGKIGRKAEGHGLIPDELNEEQPAKMPEIDNMDPATVMDQSTDDMGVQQSSTEASKVAQPQTIPQMDPTTPKTPGEWGQIQRKTMGPADPALATEWAAEEYTPEEYFSAIEQMEVPHSPVPEAVMGTEPPGRGGQRMQHRQAEFYDYNGKKLSMDDLKQWFQEDEMVSGEAFNKSKFDEWLARLVREKRIEATGDDWAKYAHQAQVTPPPGATAPPIPSPTPPAPLPPATSTMPPPATPPAAMPLSSEKDENGNEENGKEKKEECIIGSIRSSVGVVAYKVRKKDGSVTVVPASVMKQKRAQREETKKWFEELVDKLGLGFHPDTPFEEYANLQTGEPTFTPEEAAQYNKMMEDVFNTVEDPYEIGVEVWREKGLIASRKKAEDLYDPAVNEQQPDQVPENAAPADAIVGPDSSVQPAEELEPDKINEQPQGDDQVNLEPHIAKLIIEAEREARKGWDIEKAAQRTIERNFPHAPEYVKHDYWNMIVHKLAQSVINPDTSTEEATELEPGGKIKQQHPATDQAGTSLPDPEMEADTDSGANMSDIPDVPVEPPSKLGIRDTFIETGSLRDRQKMGANLDMRLIQRLANTGQRPFGEGRRTIQGAISGKFAADDEDENDSDENGNDNDKEEKEGFRHPFDRKAQTGRETPDHQPAKGDMKFNHSKGHAEGTRWVMKVTWNPSQMEGMSEGNLAGNVKTYIQQLGTAEEDMDLGTIADVQIDEIDVEGGEAVVSFKSSNIEEATPAEIHVTEEGQNKPGDDKPTSTPGRV